MFLLTICDITYLEDKNNYDEAYRMVSEYRKNKADTLKGMEDKMRCVASGILLNATLSQWHLGKMFSEELHFLNIKQAMTEYDTGYDYDIFTVANGKPVFLGHEDIHFNISHAGKYVVCVVADGPVGVDIEGGRAAGTKVAKRFFSDEECKWIEQGDSVKRFFKIWTAREAYGKLTGEGIARTIGRVRVKYDYRPEIVDNSVLRDDVIIKEYTVGEDFFIALAKYKIVG